MLTVIDLAILAGLSMMCGAFCGVIHILINEKKGRKRVNVKQ